MIMEEFLYGTFVPSEKDKILQQLAKQYHTETENYDLSVCGGRNKYGEAVPVNNWEYCMINRNAIALLKRLLTENPSIDRRDLLRAIRNYREH